MPDEDILWSPTKVRLFGLPYAGFAFKDTPHPLFASVYGYGYKRYYVRLPEPVVLAIPVGVNGVEIPNNTSITQYFATRLGIAIPNTGETFLDNTQMWSCDPQTYTRHIKTDEGLLLDLLGEKDEAAIVEPQAPLQPQLQSLQATTGEKQASPSPRVTATPTLTHMALIAAGMVFVALFAFLVLGTFWAGFIARYADRPGCCATCVACPTPPPSTAEKPPTMNTPTTN
jgi:hypothetical protein